MSEDRTSEPREAPVPGSMGQPQGVEDARGASLGLGRLVMAAFWLLGLWLTVMALVDLFRHRTGPWGPEILALIAGVVYLIAAGGITHNGKRMRIIAWAALGVSISAPIILAIASIDVPELGAARSAWAGLGADFVYVPLIVSVIGVVWMWLSNPRRIVEIAEQVERPGRYWR